MRGAAELADAVRQADLAIALRAAQATPCQGGWALRAPGLADHHHLNRVVVTAALSRLEPAPAAALAALADRWLNGLSHQRVTVHDADGALAIAAEMEQAGFRLSRAVLMVLGAEADGGPVDRRARPLSARRLSALQREVYAEDLGPRRAATGLPDHLARAQEAMRQATTWVGFGAAIAAGGAPVSMATLFLDPDVDGRRVAIIDQVATLVAHREQGLARAVTTAAIRSARDWGADVVGLSADGNDWPQLMYLRVGFTAVGDTVSFDRAGVHRASGRGQA